MGMGWYPFESYAHPNPLNIAQNPWTKASHVGLCIRALLSEVVTTCVSQCHRILSNGTLMRFIFLMNVIRPDNSRRPWTHWQYWVSTCMTAWELQESSWCPIFFCYVLGPDCVSSHTKYIHCLVALVLYIQTWKLKYHKWLKCQHPFSY